VTAEGPRGQTTIVEPSLGERTVARRVAESRATVPHLELSISRDPPGEVDTARLIRACARALAEHPRANAAYRDGRFELYSRINIGLVLALPEAYLIPTVFDADGRKLDELRREVEDLRAGAAAGRLAAGAFSGATFTVWNASQHGLAQASIPVVPPQAGALAAGMTALTLSTDHRILYGDPAAGFLRSVSRQLEGD
jgi:pyruvate dehydrogenase E2 component (dihydrolipoamide acetyltransferase)